MGGKPYLPNGFEYPKTYDEPHPLAFLAQNNFEEFEDFEDFLNKDLPEMSEGQLPFNKTISVKLVGGYGNFSQEDPRGCYEGKYKDYLVTLFTSESGTGTMWWDEGVANFFIKRRFNEKELQ
ncbi:hypothetical protein QTN25_000066 [Entamoeba marina]